MSAPPGTLVWCQQPPMAPSPACYALYTHRYTWHLGQASHLRGPALRTNHRSFPPNDHAQLLPPRRHQVWDLQQYHHHLLLLLCAVNSHPRLHYLARTQHPPIHMSTLLLPPSALDPRAIHQSQAFTPDTTYGSSFTTILLTTQAGITSSPQQILCTSSNM